MTTILRKTIALALAVSLPSVGLEGCKSKKKASSVKSESAENKRGYALWTLNIKMAKTTPSEEVLECWYYYENTLSWFRDQPAASNWTLYRDVALSQPEGIKHVNGRPLTRKQITDEIKVVGGKAMEIYDANVRERAADAPVDLSLLYANEILMTSIERLHARNVSQAQFRCPAPQQVADALVKSKEASPGTFSKRIILDSGLQNNGQPIKGLEASSAGMEKSFALANVPASSALARPVVNRLTMFTGGVLESLDNLLPEVAEGISQTVFNKGVTREIAERAGQTGGKGVRIPRGDVGELNQTPISQRLLKGSTPEGNPAAPNPASKVNPNPSASKANPVEVPPSKVTSYRNNIAEDIKASNAKGGGTPNRATDMIVNGKTAGNGQVKVQDMPAILKDLESTPEWMAGGVWRPDGHPVKVRLARLKNEVDGFLGGSPHVQEAKVKAAFDSYLELLHSEQIIRAAPVTAKTVSRATTATSGSAGDAGAALAKVDPADPGQLSAAVKPLNEHLKTERLQVVDLGRVPSGPLDTPQNLLTGKTRTPADPTRDVPLTDGKNDILPERPGGGSGNKPPVGDGDGAGTGTGTGTGSGTGTGAGATGDVKGPNGAGPDGKGNALLDRARALGRKSWNWTRRITTLGLWTVVPGYIAWNALSQPGAQPPAPAEVSFSSTDDVPWANAERAIEEGNNPGMPSSEAIQAALNEAAAAAGADLKTILDVGTTPQRKALACGLVTKLGMCFPVSICISSLLSTQDNGVCLERPCNAPDLNEKAAEPQCQ